MEAWREAMLVEYDDGYFDKDEQGWCANVHALRLEGDTLHVHRHGDFAGQRPFEQRSTLRVLGAVPGLELVLLAAGTGRAVFDLRARKLHQGSLTTSEKISPALVPDAASLDAWIARALRVHAATAGRSFPGAALVWSAPQAYPLGDPGTTFTRGEIEPGATVDALRGPDGALLSLTVTRGNDPRVSSSWSVHAPKDVEVRGWLQAHELARFRASARAEMFAGEPSTWEEDLRQLAALEALP